MRDSERPSDTNGGVYDPDKNLRALFTEAYTRYRNEVIGSGKSYDRYADDFISDHRYNSAFTLQEENSRYTNTMRIDSLLRERRDLVEKYFSSKVFGPTDFVAMYSDFNRGTDVPGSKSTGVRTENFGSSLTDTQIAAIAAVANDFNIFTRQVTAGDVANLFSASPDVRLVSANNRRLAMLFDTLASADLICGDWQRVIAASGTVISSSGTPLTQDRLSSALNGARSERSAVFSTIRKRVNEIADAT